MNEEQVPEGDTNFLNMVRQANERRATPPEQTGDTLDASAQQKEEVQKEEVQKEERGEQPTGDGQEDQQSDILTDPLEATPKKNTKTENLKNLRNNLKVTKDRVTELEDELSEARKQLESKDVPSEVQEQLAAYEKKVEKLEKYEKLLGLYQTDGYKETFYDSEQQLIEQAKSIADDYGVEHEVIDQLLSVTNRKQLIEGLQDYFDIHTAGELRDIVLKRQEILKGREAADTDPEKARQELLALTSERQKAKTEKAFKEMSTTVQVGWERMLEKYSDKNTGLEVLQERPGDKEHSEQRDGLLGRAQGELAKFMTAFVQGGLTQMPEQLAQALAARFQLSEATGVLHQQNKALQKRVEELEAEHTKLTKYSRPLTNGAAGGGKKAPVGGNEITRKDVASHVMAKALEQTG